MPIGEIDTWTKRIVSAAAPDIRRAVGVDRLEPELVREVCVQVQDVLSRLDRVQIAEIGRKPGLIDQLALVIYVAVATVETRRRATPGLLTSLNRSLTRALAGAASGTTSPSPSQNPDGGTR